MELKTSSFKGFISGGTLKIIAIVSMLIDHTAAVLVDPSTAQYTIMRDIGRLAFPIFCFLLVEGFLHTKNVKRYAIRLGLFAMISEVPFDLAFANSIFNMNHQNVFFTLFIGLLVLITIQQFEHNKIIVVLSIIIGCLAALFLQTDYSYFGILMILFFYLYQKEQVTRAITVILLNVVLGQWIAGLSLIPISLYNGKRGISLKYLFYIFYPAHILILYFVRLYA